MTPLLLPAPTLKMLVSNVMVRYIYFSPINRHCMISEYIHPTNKEEAKTTVFWNQCRQARDDHEMATGIAATHSFSVSEDAMCISKYGHLTCDKKAKTV